MNCPYCQHEIEEEKQIVFPVIIRGRKTQAVEIIKPPRIWVSTKNAHGCTKPFPIVLVKEV